MSSIEQQAAEVIDRVFSKGEPVSPTGTINGDLARALATAGLLRDDTEPIMSSDQERAVKVLLANRSCDFCEFLTDPGNHCPYCEREALQMVNDLAAAGLLAPDLPSDNVPPLGSGEWSAGFEYVIRSDDAIDQIGDAHAYAWAPGKVGVSAPKIMTTDQAEALALVLLAAVKSDRAYSKANQVTDISDGNQP